MSDEFVEDEGGESLEVMVPYTLDGMRIDRALAILTGLSRAEALAILEDGRVQINEKVISKASYHLEDGQHLVAQLPVQTMVSCSRRPTYRLMLFLKMSSSWS